MNSRLSLTLAAVLALSGAACSDDSNGSHVKPTGDGSVAHADGGGGSTDGGGASTDGAASDAGSPDGAAPGSLALVDYVNDLVDHHTDDTSTPDDVASRTIIDNQDPAAFNSRFP